jgi:hypothetical protein
MSVNDRADTIFVAIASYRDSECQWTVRDLFKRAAHPERIMVGICGQYLLPEDAHCFAVDPPFPARVRRRDFDARESRGCCWAKRVSLEMHTNESYILMIDSHMRFEQDWDDRLIGMLAECPSAKPVITSFPAPYWPPNEKVPSTHILIPKGFNAHCVLELATIPQRSAAPLPAAFAAGGFMFARSSLFKEVPYDPQQYFVGSEPAYSARVWTSGWDMFSPHECLIYHYYKRTAPYHWDDDTRWTRLNEKSLRRIRHLLRTDVLRPSSVTIGLDGRLGLGSARTIQEYQRFAGVNFRTLRIEKRARLGLYGQSVAPVERKSAPGQTLRTATRKALVAAAAEASHFA